MTNDNQTKNQSAPASPAGYVSPAPSERQKLRTTCHSSRRFIHPDADEIFLSGHPLRQHLEMTNDKTPFVISDLLDEQDWSVFEQDYAESGRPPYAPRCMAGLILYAIINGVTSLRFIERMARMDLGCMWVSGGIFPDHANIGRFITRHQEALNGSFFEALTQSVLCFAAFIYSDLGNISDHRHSMANNR